MRQVTVGVFGTSPSLFDSPCHGAPLLCSGVSAGLGPFAYLFFTKLSETVGEAMVPSGRVRSKSPQSTYVQPAFSHTLQDEHEHVYLGLPDSAVSIC